MIIREATLFDAAGIARVHIDSSRTAYHGILSEEYLEQLSYEKLTEYFVTAFRVEGA